ncbi:MAG: hypothetical protein LJE84_01485 [Gammaproteobacteria bacterium]|nr:hypothetical protein [Gammaproteobacteria bacterium]
MNGRLLGSTLALLLALSGCSGGGGGSKSGPPPGFSGTYTGTETLTLSAPGVPAVSLGTFAVNITVAANGSVTITNVDGNQFAGSITGASISASGSFSLGAIQGLTCTVVTLNYAGTVNGTTITGTIGGSVTCTNAVGVSLTATISGTFTVSLSTVSATRLEIGNSVRAAIEQQVRNSQRR